MHLDGFRQDGITSGAVSFVQQTGVDRDAEDFFKYLKECDDEGGRMHGHRDEVGTGAVMLLNIGAPCEFFVDSGFPSHGCTAQNRKEQWCAGNGDAARPHYYLCCRSLPAAAGGGDGGESGELEFRVVTDPQKWVTVAPLHKCPHCDYTSERVCNVQEHVSQVNSKMKDTLDVVGRSSDKLCVDVMCLLFLIGLCIIAYQLLTKKD